MHLLFTEGTDGAYEWAGTRVELAAELGVTPEALHCASGVAGERRFVGEGLAAGLDRLSSGVLNDACDDSSN